VSVLQCPASSSGLGPISREQQRFFGVYCYSVKCSISALSLAIVAVPSLGIFHHYSFCMQKKKKCMVSWKVLVFKFNTDMGNRKNYAYVGKFCRICCLQYLMEDSKLLQKVSIHSWDYTVSKNRKLQHGSPPKSKLQM